MATYSKIGALWKTSKQGFITGTLDVSIGQQVKVGIGVNDKKRAGTKDPDFYIYHLPETRPVTGEPPEVSDEPPF